MYGIELRKRSPIKPRAGAVRMCNVRIHYDRRRSGCASSPKRERNSSLETTWIG
jgi:hypothetical protein